MFLRTFSARAGALTAAALLTALGYVAGDQPALAQEGSPAPVLASDAPKSYTVAKGDTLWDIASLFLRDPWLWPEIWYVNPQVENPHLIYPGDVLTLTYGPDGRPQLTLERGTGASRLSPKMRSTPLEGAITAIPYEAVAAFMSRPMVLDRDEIEAAPHVVSSRDQHLAASAGNTIYVSNLEGEVGSHYSIIHVGEPLRDPEDNELLGFQGIFTGDAQLTRNGDPATLQITTSARETYAGDILFPTDVDVPLDFVPHAPQGEIDGSIISLVNAISMTGQYQGVAINRGKEHGLEPGHVLAIYQVGPTIRDRSDRMNTSRVRGGTFARKVKLPDERAGTMMIFKVFEGISYALILESQAPIRNFDRVRNP